ncbi:OsmC family protein [bacterium]|nr:OsmC family protein [bacterium]
MTRLADMAGMRFEGETASGHTIVMDAKAEVGGKDAGARPKELPFVGLAGCTGMDVISILRKMRQEPDRFDIEVEGITSTVEHPKYWEEIRVIYHVEGDIDQEKLTKAINLSRTRYCGVSAMLKGKVTVHYQVILNGESTDLPDNPE